MLSPQGKSVARLCMHTTEGENERKDRAGSEKIEQLRGEPTGKMGA